MIDSVYEEIAPGKSRNTMKVETLRRSDLGAEFTCFGNNNNDTQPVANTVRLKLNREYCTGAVTGAEMTLALPYTFCTYAGFPQPRANRLVHL